jgi:hypothetical protein
VSDIHVARDIQDFITKNTQNKKPSKHVEYIPCNSEILNHALGGGPAVRKEPPSAGEEKKSPPPAKKVEEAKVAANIPVPPPMDSGPAQNSSANKKRVRYHCFHIFAIQSFV